MAGCGRKHRAKHLTSEYLDETGWEGPADRDDYLGVVLEPPTGKRVHLSLVDTASLGLAVAVTPSTSSATLQTATDGTVYAQLPGRFLKVVWIGVGDVVVARHGEVTRKLSKPQLARFVEQHPEMVAAINAAAPGGAYAGWADNDGDNAVAPDDLDDFVNPNRQSIKHQAHFFGEDDDEEDEDEDEEEDEEEDDDGDSADRQ